MLPTVFSRSDVIRTLPNSPILIKVPRQAVSDIQNTRKRTAGDSLLQALRYKHFLSRYNPVTLRDFKSKRQKLWLAKERVRRNIPDGIKVLGWWRCAPFSSISFTLGDPSHRSSSDHTQNTCNESKAVDHSRSEECMPLLRLHAGPAVQHATNRFESASESTPAEKSLLALAGLNAGIVSVTESPVENGSGGDRQQKEYTEPCAKIFYLPKNELIRSVRQFSQSSVK